MGTFLGIAVAILVALVTFLIGFDIYKIIDVDKKITKWEAEFNIVKKYSEDALMQSYIASGSSLIDRQPITAFHAFHNRLEFGLKICNYDKMSTTLSNMTACLDSLDSFIANKDKDSIVFKSDIEKEIERPIKHYDYYPNIKDEYEKIMSRFKELKDKIKSSGI
jgi:hypothetical protein